VDLRNRTDANARLLGSGADADHQLGCLIARPTFRIEGRELVPTPDAPWPIEPTAHETEYGAFPGDVPFLTGGIDVFVVGNAYAPNGSASQLDVSVQVGADFGRTIRVVGDRTWERSADGLRPSEPEPFRSMPLGWEQAFGGKVVLDTGELPFGANPAGKGFYIEEERAVGQPLPNLEDPADPVERWDDRPEPVGTAPYPPDGFLRVLNAIDFDPENLEDPRLDRIKPLFFNAAHPKMILEPGREPKPGDDIEVSGVRPDGALRFAMPDVPFHAHVQLEERSYLFPLHLDQIGILADTLRVFLSYRVVFRYRVAPLERRRVTLHAGRAPVAVPDDYVEEWED